MGQRHLAVRYYEAKEDSRRAEKDSGRLERDASHRWPMPSSEQQEEDE